VAHPVALWRLRSNAGATTPTPPRGFAPRRLRDIIGAEVTRDPKDNPVVACAVEGRAGYIVSGDLDLLDLGEHRGIQVVTPRRFLELLE
jgi:hypothetical protein